jgi:hypothetical protein
MTTEARHLDDARRRLDLSHYDLWVRYVGLGGNRDAFAVRSYLTGHGRFSDSDHDHLTAALNEALIDTGEGAPLPYRYA